MQIHDRYIEFHKNFSKRVFPFKVLGVVGDYGVSGCLRMVTQHVILVSALIPRNGLEIILIYTNASEIYRTPRLLKLLHKAHFCK